MTFVKGSVNVVITESVPLNKDLKRYLLSRWAKLCNCNGQKYAADVFKTAREVLLAYRADSRRLENLPEYLRRLPFTHKGWMKSLLHYMDCQPMMVLDFMKLYCGMSKPLIEVSESATRQHRYLKGTKDRVDTRVPGALSGWLDVVLHWDIPDVVTYTIKQLQLQGKLSGDANVPALLVPAWKHHDYATFKAYLLKWRHILDVPRVTDLEATTMILGRTPVPESYQDFDASQIQSKSLDYDYWVVACWLEPELRGSSGWSTPMGDPSTWVNGMPPAPQPTLSDESLEYVQSYLNQSPGAISVLDKTGPDPTVWTPDSSSLTFLTGECVGEIQHIPKKGTIKRRPIAVPNRFLQMGLVPIQQQLERLVRRLPQDCTFNQGKMDVKITNRVTNPNLYVGSVDLSQATDNLPLTWGEVVVDALFGVRSWPIVKASYCLFKEMARGRWDNDGIISGWPVGQPLGTLPSFDILAITHNLLLESMSFSSGLLHSPYCILGDDLLVFNKKLRERYIAFMESAGVPLSLHKSYEGNLVEFAGKVFIRNQIPAYSSDHSPITWNSLFDYQRATGVKIGWRMVPNFIRKKFIKTTVTAGLPASDSERVYKLCQLALMEPRGSLNHLPNQQTIDLVASFFVAMDDDDTVLPDRIMTSGIVNVGGHPVTYGDYGYANKDGHLQRYVETKLPQWYKDKVRPCATDKAISCAVQALRSVC